MSTFKGIAYEILRDAGKPLHYKEITKIALKNGWLKTAGKTPEATMNAQLVVDINTKKNASRFIKTAPSTFALNPNVPAIEKKVHEVQKEIDKEKEYFISKNVSPKQKGDIAEARIAELITLYGETSLSCYKPISDDEGIDLIVKKKGELRSVYVQIKSRYGDASSGVYTATVKSSTLQDNYSMMLVFCLFDTEQGDLWDYVWFVPATEFVKKANRLQNGIQLGFVAGRNRNESNKWDEYLIDKRGLAKAIIEHMNRM